jgi:hypothetical protein
VTWIAFALVTNTKKSEKRPKAEKLIADLLMALHVPLDEELCKTVTLL